MKVFRMDDYDWVAANDEDEAIEFYYKLTGVKEDEDDIEEVDLDENNAWCELLNIKDLEKLTDFAREFTIKKGDNDWTTSWVIHLTFREALIYYSKTEPYIFMSTEY